MTMDTALAISDAVHNTHTTTDSKIPNSQNSTSNGAKEYFDHSAESFGNCGRALLVGVFQNQPLSYILETQRRLNLDIVQLHGSEPIEWASLIPVPVIHRFGPSDPGLGARGYHALPLLDTSAGGTGEMLDSVEIQDRLQSDPGLRVILAGGLNAENVADVLVKLESSRSSIVVVDVSSGVEQDGQQNLEKIKKFVRAAKEAHKDMGSPKANGS